MCKPYHSFPQYQSNLHCWTLIYEKAQIFLGCIMMGSQSLDSDLSEWVLFNHGINSLMKCVAALYILQGPSWHIYMGINFGGRFRPALVLDVKCPQSSIIEDLTEWLDPEFCFLFLKKQETNIDVICFCFSFLWDNIAWAKEALSSVIALVWILSIIFAKQVVLECKEIYENSLVDGNPPKAGFVFTKVKCLSASKGSLWRKLT